MIVNHRAGWDAERAGRVAERVAARVAEPGGAGCGEGLDGVRGVKGILDFLDEEDSRDFKDLRYLA